MSKNKSVSKSLRMTDQIFSYIDNYRGSGFNEKFENIILDAMLSEPQRLASVEKLDAQILEQRRTLLKLSAKFQDLDAMQRDFAQLKNSIAALSDKLLQF